MPRITTNNNKVGIASGQKQAPALSSTGGRKATFNSTTQVARTAIVTPATSSVTTAIRPANITSTTINAKTAI